MRSFEEVKVERKLRQNHSRYRAPTALLLGLGLVSFMACGSDTSEQTNGQDPSRVVFPDGATRPIDPVTGLPLPPSAAEQSLNQTWRSGGAGVASGNNGDAAAEGSVDIGSRQEPGDGNTVTTTRPGSPSPTMGPGGAPPSFAGTQPVVTPPPTPPPTRPPATPTTAGTPITRPPSTTSTTLAGQTVLPFRCSVRAEPARIPNLSRTYISVSGANREEAWLLIRWSNAEDVVAIDLSSGTGRLEIATRGNSTPEVFVFETVELFGSTLGCSFTP